MSRNRVLTFVVILGIAGLGLTVLMAAGDPAEKRAPATPQAAGGKTLVCLGAVDTEDKMIGIYPNNFPQPSQVIKVLKKEGEEVKAGEELLELDSDLAALRVTEADAGIESANAQLAQAEAAIRAHASGIKVAEKELLAKEAELDARKKELDDAKAAVANGSKSKVELSVPEANVKAADLTLQAVQLKLDLTRTESPTYLRDLANANIKKYQELRKQAVSARDQIKCTAKSDGTIIRTFVSAGSSFGPMTREPAFWFVKKGPLLVRAEVTQEFANRVSKGQSADIEDETDSKQRWSGTVTKVGEQFLPKRHANGGGLDIFPVNDDRVLECLISIDQSTNQPPPRFGQKVRVTIGK
jgi:multidrug efflux pump subunit AcrA (membrane-fusion protein)